ncbi:MAG: type II toxin-antitoxin system CcdA family antitoxin [Pseudomonadota bacterium]
MPIPKPVTTPRRRSVNLTIPEDIMAAAKKLGINASKAAEAGLRQEVKKKLGEQWLAENQSALNAHNKRVEKQETLLTPDWARD